MLLYYITDRRSFPGTPHQQRAALLQWVGDAARAGVDYIQLREKDLNPADLELLAREALHLVRECSQVTKLLLNTHSDIARSIGADGVHLPGHASTPSQIRSQWRREDDREPVIGVSVHTLEDLRRAELHGANFTVFAPVFEKVSAGLPGTGVEALREACATAGKPVLALGGVTLRNAAACLDSGAAGIAGIRLFQLGDVTATVRTLRGLR